MANLSKYNLFEGSFRGKTFYLNTASTVSGGQKLAVYDYANSNRRDIFYMGDKPSEYTLRALLNPDLSKESYVTVRTEFINALKERGKGRLVHPFYGDIDCYVESWSCTEDTTRLGFVEFDITFKVDVQPTQNAANTLFSDPVTQIINQKLLPTLQAQLILPPKSPVYLDKLFNFINALQTSIILVRNRDIAAIADILIGGNIRSLLSNTIGIYNLLRTVFRSLGRNPTLPADATAFATNMKDFNESLEPRLVNYTTANAMEYNNNILLFKSTTDILTLDAMYQYAFDNGFESIVDLELYKTITDDIFKNFRNNCPSDDLIQIGEDIKELFTLFLEQQSLNTLRVVEVDIPGEPLDVLLYRYYEDLSFRDRIIKLNNIKDTSWVEGKVRLLTK
jgi:hypothetical protein